MLAVGIFSLVAEFHTLTELAVIVLLMLYLNIYDSVNKVPAQVLDGGIILSCAEP